MMGLKARAVTARHTVSLEDLVPADDFYRHLDRVLDLAFVRDLVRETYAPVGRPSIDPVVFFRMASTECPPLRVPLEVLCRGSGAEAGQRGRVVRDEVASGGGVPLGREGAVGDPLPDPAPASTPASRVSAERLAARRASR